MSQPVTSSSAGSTTTSSGTSIPADPSTSANPKLSRTQRKNRNRRAVVKDAKKPVETAAEEAKKKALSSVTGTASTAPPTASTVATPRPGGVGLALTQSTSQPASETTTGLGTLSRKDDEHLYPYDEAILEWNPTNDKGEKILKRAIRYAVSLNIPLRKKEREYIKEDLENYAKEFAKVWVADAEAYLNAPGCPLTPGQVLTAMFEGDKGYLLFHPKVGLDPKALSREDIIDKYTTVKAEGPSSKALSTFLSEGKPEKFREELAKPVYETLRRDATTKTDKAGDNYPPSNLVNTGSRCFVNSPFLNLVRHPGIRKELRDPKNFVDGAKNPLFIKLNGYLDHQASGNTKPYDLGDLAAQLEIDETRQDDVDYVWRKFGEQIHPDIAKTSPLHSLFAQELMIAPDGASSAEALIQKAADTDWKGPKLPDTFSVAVSGRVGFKTKALSELTADQKAAIVRDITAHRAADVVATLKDELKATFEDNVKGLCDRLTEDDNYDTLYQLVDTNKNPDQRVLLDRLYGLQLLASVSDAELVTDAHWDTLCKVLTVEQRARVGAERREASPKIDTAIAKPHAVTIESGGKSADYELISFSLHIGDSADGGHYVTYEKRGDKYWCIDDQLDASTSIDEKTFREMAQTAALCVYGTKEMTAASTGGASTPKPPGNREVEDQRIKVGYADSIVEVGKLINAGEGVVLVNPTDSALDRVDSQLDADPLTMRTDLAAQRQKIFDERGSFITVKKWRTKKIDLEAGKTSVGQLTLSGGKSAEVLHASLGDWSTFDTSSPEGLTKVDEAVAKTVKGALEKAAEGNHGKVAFPLIVIPGYPVERSYAEMRKAINAFLTEKIGEVHPIREVKIVITEEQKKQIGELNPQKKVAKAAAATKTAPPEYQVGTHTTLVVDSTGPMPTSFANGSTGRRTLAQDLADRFAALLADNSELTVDLTCGDATGPTQTDPNVMRVDIGYYGYRETGVSEQERIANAIATFHTALETFANANHTRKIKIKLKVPNGSTVKPYPLVGSSPTPAGPTSTTASPPPPATTANDIIRAAQTQFMASFTPPAAASIISIGHSGSKGVYNCQVSPYTTRTKPPSPLAPFKKGDEGKLYTDLSRAAIKDNLDEIVIDCRPDCASQQGVFALDLRHFDDADTNIQMQRLRNFIGLLVSQYRIIKPIKLILPEGMPALPKHSIQLYSRSERWNPIASVRQSSHGAAPTA